MINSSSAAYIDLRYNNSLPYTYPTCHPTYISNHITSISTIYQWQSFMRVSRALRARGAANHWQLTGSPISLLSSSSSPLGFITPIGLVKMSATEIGEPHETSNSRCSIIRRSRQLNPCQILSKASYLRLSHRFLPPKAQCLASSSS